MWKAPIIAKTGVITSINWLSFQPRLFSDECSQLKRLLNMERELIARKTITLFKTNGLDTDWIYLTWVLCTFEQMDKLRFEVVSKYILLGFLLCGS